MTGDIAVRMCMVMVAPQDWFKLVHLAFGLLSRIVNVRFSKIEKPNKCKHFPPTPNKIAFAWS